MNFEDSNDVLQKINIIQHNLEKQNLLTKESQEAVINLTFLPIKKSQSEELCVAFKTEKTEENARKFNINYVDKELILGNKVINEITAYDSLYNVASVKANSEFEYIEYGDENVETNNTFEKIISCKPKTGFDETYLPLKLKIEEKLAVEKAKENIIEIHEYIKQKETKSFFKTKNFNESQKETAQLTSISTRNKDLKIDNSFYQEPKNEMFEANLKKSNQLDLNFLLKETSNKNQNLYSLMDVYENELSAEKNLNHVEKTISSLFTNASKIETCQKTEELHPHNDNSDSTIQSIKALKLKENEIRSFAISQNTIQTNLEQKDIAKDYNYEKILKAINNEPPISRVLREINDSTIDTAAFLCRIVSSNKRVSGTENQVNIPRKWKENINTTAAGNENKLKEVNLINPEAIYHKKKVLKSKNFDMHVKSLMASTIKNIKAPSLSLSKISSSNSFVTGNIVDSSKETCSTWLREQKKILKSLQTNIKTIDTDLEAEFVHHITPSLIDSLKTKASDVVDINVLNEFLNIPNNVDCQTVEDFTLNEKENRLFKITSSNVFQQFNKSGILSKTQEKIPQKNQGTAVVIETNEQGDVTLDAGVMLVQLPVKKSHKVSDHVVNISKVLTQTLATLYAKDIKLPNLNVEWKGKEVKNDATKIIKDKNTLHNSIKINEASEEVISQMEDLSKHSVKEAECVKKFVTDRREKSTERLLEFRDDGFEILSQWVTVDRDLEADTCISSKLNQYAKKNILECVEEIQNINENWEKGLSKAFVIKVFNIRIESKTTKTFKILTINTNSELFKKHSFNTESAEKTLNIAHFAQPVDRELYEFGNKTLNAIVALHCVSGIPSKTPSQITLIERSKICIRSLNIYIDSDTIQFNKEIKAPTINEFIQKIHKYFNLGTPISINVDESSNERLKMSIDIQAKTQQNLCINKIYKIANFEQTTPVIIREFEEDECLLYAQLTTRDVKWFEKNTTINISRDLTPSLKLICKSAGDVKKNVNEQWEKALPVLNTQTLIWIPNSGENIKRRMKEASKVVSQVAYIYDKKDNVEYVVIVQKNYHFGGLYKLATKTTTKEERNQTISLNKKQAMELIRMKMPYRFKLEITSMCLLESTQENANINYSFERQQSVNNENIKCNCAREIFSVELKLKETTDIYVTTNYELKDEKITKDLVYLIQNIPLNGGVFLLATNEAENIILNALRELKKDEQFVFIQKTIIDSNKYIPIQHQTKASMLESIICNNIWAHENELENTQIIIKDKNSLSPTKLRTKESKEFSETSYYKYSKKMQIESISFTQKEARNGGGLKLKSEAVQESNATFIRKLDSNHIQVAHCSKKFINANVDNPLMFYAKSSGSSDCWINAAIQRSEAREKCAKNTRAAREILGTFLLSIFESNEEIQRINCDYKQKQMDEILEKIFIIARYGGNAIITTIASGDKQFNNSFNLVKKMDHISSPSLLTIKSSRSIEPIKFKLAESKYLEINIGIQWVHENEFEICEIFKKSANEYAPIKLRAIEAKLYNEVTNFQYFRPENIKDISILIKDKRFGGNFQISTKSTTNENANLSNENIQKIKRFEDLLNTNPFIIEDIRWAKKTLLNTKASGNIISSVNYNLCKSIASEKQRLIRRSANEAKTYCRIKESKAHSETFNCNYKRLLESNSINHIVNEKRFGGNFVLDGKKAGDANTSLFKDLNEASLRNHLTEKIIQITNEPVGTIPFYRCKASTSSNVVLNSDLKCKEGLYLKKEENTKIISINRVSPAQRFNSHESLFSHEYINCQYNKPHSKFEIAATLYEPCFGGRVLLNTNASGEKTININSNLCNSRADTNKLGSSSIIKISREAAPTILSSKATESSNVSTTTQLQRTDQRLSTIPFKIIWANRFSNPPSIRVTETKEIEQLNNVQFNRAEQFISAVDYIYLESRKGGHFFLKTLSASESHIHIKEDWKIDESNVSAPTHIVRIFNEGPSIPIFNCSCSTIQNSNINVDLNANIVASLNSNITLTEINKGTLIQFKSIESSSSTMTTNIALQSLKMNSEEETEPLTIKISHLGGSYNIHCRASGEIDSGEKIISLHRSSAEAFADPYPLIIPIPAIGLSATLKGAYAQEATFNVDVVLTYQSNEATFEYTLKDIRQGSTAILESGGTTSESVALTKTEISRRLTEVQIETVVARAPREILPISLNTEYARETIIRLDSIIESFEWKHNQKLQCVWNDIQTIIIEKFKCEAVDLVRMRKSLLDTDKETKEKRFF